MTKDAPTGSLSTVRSATGGGTEGDTRPERLVTGGVPGGVAGGVPGGVLGDVTDEAAGAAVAAGRPARPAFRLLVAAWLRRRFWRTVLFLTGGLTVKGKLPKGGCVVVANHSSHADTAVLLAALGVARAPRVAAAADYWFRNRVRRLVCSVLAAAFPVRRHGGGYSDLQDIAGPMLRAGHAVVVFPEGTRGAGRVGTFRRGAVELAVSNGVPVVPVALSGTAELLPKRGRLRPHAVRVRIGRPLVDPDADTARTAVLELLAECRPRDSRVRRRIARLAMSWTGLGLVAAWSFTEALSWPLLPELALAVLCVAAPRAGLRLTVSAAVASVAGGLVALALYSGTSVELPQPLTTTRMHTTAQNEIRSEGARAVRHQPASGIPYKVYAAEAGRAGVPAGEWVLRSTAARGERIVGVGLVLTLIGVLTQRWRRFFPQYLIFVGVAFVALFTLVIGSWQ
ncbi:1-acyl-sn-glycerol-3-phosphate acyltransferase [Streptomyces sp. DR7-3]|uniref:lysophospholipid acyltransferase family protein n=1 Tax=Streptomyces malaysiensis TaxID=92644 RepID=UPI002043660A|nr:lysophospholipid acyltransferase family protein [Streptomyces sp. DR7-3]MCM3805589.1 1-acyl-sn-glycerol-3-phosphate acyltransferase [Streptomyces sp. DR7-3]